MISWFNGPILSAIVYMTLSSFTYSLQNLTVKYSSKFATFWTITCLRGCVGACFGILLSGSNIFQKEHIYILLLRGLLGGVTITTAFFAISNTNLLPATVILSTAPLWTALISRVIKKGQSTWTFSDFISSVECIGGIVLVTSHKRTKSYNGYLGICAAVTSAISQGGVNVLVKCTGDTPPPVVVFYGTAGSILVTLPGLIYEEISGISISSLTTQSVVPILTVGCLSFFAQFFKTRAIQISNGWYILILRYLEIVFSCIYEALIFKTTLLWQDYVGSLLVLVGCISCIIIKHITTIQCSETSTKQNDNPV